MSATPVLDEESLARLTAIDDDGTFVTEMIDLFVADSTAHVARLVQQRQSGSLDHVARSAHRLKTGSAQLGGLRFSALCRELETAAEEADAVRVSALTHRLQDEHDTLVSALVSARAELTTEASDVGADLTRPD